MSPILWDDKFRKTELKGSPVLEQSREREAALRAEWADIAAAIAALPNSGDFAATEFSDDAFLRAACVVLAHAIYLPSAQCFALLPFVSLMQRTGNGDGCDVDYDAGTARQQAPPCPTSSCTFHGPTRASAACLAPSLTTA